MVCFDVKKSSHFKIVVQSGMLMIKFNLCFYTEVVYATEIREKNTWKMSVQKLPLKFPLVSFKPMSSVMFTSICP